MRGKREPRTLVSRKDSNRVLAKPILQERMNPCLPVFTVDVSYSNQMYGTAAGKVYPTAAVIIILSTWWWPTTGWDGACAAWGLFHDTFICGGHGQGIVRCQWAAANRR